MHSSTCRAQNGDGILTRGEMAAALRRGVSQTQWSQRVVFEEVFQESSSRFLVRRGYIAFVQVVCLSRGYLGVDQYFWPQNDHVTFPLVVKVLCFGGCQLMVTPCITDLFDQPPFLQILLQVAKWCSFSFSWEGFPLNATNFVPWKFTGRLRFPQVPKLRLSSCALCFRGAWVARCPRANWTGCCAASTPTALAASTSRRRWDVTLG